MQSSSKVLRLILAFWFFSNLFLLSSSAIAWNLAIWSQTTNAVTVAWPSSDAYVLQTNVSLKASAWGVYTGIVVNRNGSNWATVQPVNSLEFFRLQYAGLTDPTNIPGMAYYWNFEDLPASDKITAWTDRVSGLTLSYISTNSIQASTTGPFPGLDIPRYGDYIAFTNRLGLFSSNFTFWVVMRPYIQGDSPNEAIFGDGAVHGINISGNVLSANWGNGPHYSSLVMNYSDPAAFPYGQTYDILDSGGTVYSNGITMAAGIGQPLDNFSFQAIGSLDSSGFTAQGYLQYIGIWTNHLLTATDATNLDFWFNNYGITNVTGGLIAWWKMNEGTGTMALDASGNGNTLYLTGTGNLWTTNSMANGGALSFNCNGWGTNSNLSLADNLSALTVSYWIQGTNFGNGIWLEKGGPPGYAGWAFFADGVTNVSFGCYGVDFSWEESPHTSYPNFPIIGDGRWHFVVGEYTNDPVAGMLPDLFIDGCKITGGEVGNNIVANIASPNYPIYVGAGSGLGANGIGGSAKDAGIVGSPCTLSDVRIYNRRLTLKEINVLYKWRGQP